MKLICVCLFIGCSALYVGSSKSKLSRDDSALSLSTTRTAAREKRFEANIKFLQSSGDENLKKFADDLSKKKNNGQGGKNQELLSKIKIIGGTTGTKVSNGLNAVTTKVNTFTNNSVLGKVSIVSNIGFFDEENNELFQITNGGLTKNLQIKLGDKTFKAQLNDWSSGRERGGYVNGFDLIAKEEILYIVFKYEDSNIQKYKQSSEEIMLEGFKNAMIEYKKLLSQNTTTNLDINQKTMRLT